MIRHNRTLMAMAVAPGALWVLALMGLFVVRASLGLSPLPDDAAPLVMGLSGVIPIASVAVVNVLRLRRRA